MSKNSKNPIEKRSSCTGWAYEKRVQAMEALRIAKSQNKPIKYLTK